MSVPLSLYLHLPWCVRKCPYCDFNSHTAGSNVPRARYIDALCLDLRREAARAADRPLISIFMGGGTPSLFTGGEIGRILDAVRARFTLADDVEITMEANPGTLERDNLAAYHAAGVNRLSLGAQSFDDVTLDRLGRIHSSADIVTAFDDARRAGFDNVNLDLMFALPGQTAAMARCDLERALALQPAHLSYYQLTLEPNTVFFRRPPEDLPDEDQAEAMQTASHARLAAHAYRQYEVSAFARDGRACRHNLNYWSFGDYLAAGAGAHGKLSDAHGRIWRYRKASHPLMYMEQAEQRAAAGDAARDLVAVPAEDVAFEYLLNALRLPAGFSEAEFHERTGLSFDAIRERIEAAAGDGLMEQAGTASWRPSERGLRYLNDLQARFLPPAAARVPAVSQAAR